MAGPGPYPFEGSGADPSEGAVRKHLDTLLEEALSHQELEGRPGAAPRVEHAVDLPLGQHPGPVPARGRPVREPRQPAELEGELRPLLDGPREVLRSDGGGEAGLAQGGGERAERVPVERLGRDPPPAVVEVACGRRAAELRSEAPEDVEELLPRREPARDEPRRPLRRVPGAEV